MGTCCEAMCGKYGQAGQHVADLEEALPASSAPVDLPGKASTPPPRSTTLSQAMKQRTIQVRNLPPSTHSEHN